MTRFRVAMATGGGDAPGLNAVIWAAVRTARLEYGDEVYGIEDGFDGLILRHDPVELTLTSVRGILPLGGTVLGTTNRGNPFEYVLPGETQPRDCSDLVLDQFAQLGLDAMVVIGGDGTMRICHELHRRGLPVVGVPKTIDNDLAGTDVTFGFDTAVNFAMEALDRLRVTAESHERVMILEVMGRYAGWIAIAAGLAGGADAILIPEIPYEPAIVVRHIRRTFTRKKSYLVVIAEGAAPTGGSRAVAEPAGGGHAERLGGAGAVLAARIAEEIAPEIRVTVLGHLQRGGSPTAFDRALAVRFGREAIHRVHEGRFGEMVALRGTEVTSVPLEEVAGTSRPVDPHGHHVATARSVGICLGDALP